MPEPALAYLSKRKLHVRRNGATRVVESEFERSVRERTASIERRHAWKTQGRGAMFTGAAFSAQANASANAPVLLTGLAATADGGLLYSMETDAVSGVFLLDSEGVETRLFHTADFRLRHAALDPTGITLAATVFNPGAMLSHIGVLPVRGNDFSEVTEGDSFDQFPQWVPGEGRKIIFQSAGIGRNAAGAFAGLGPCVIQQLNLDSGDLDELAAEEGRDLLQPRQTPDGTLYYIRKPYETGAMNASLAVSMKDAALFPFRMAQAIFQYFNVFSMMYTGKPLVNQNGAKQKHLDPRQMFIHGNLAQAQRIRANDDDAQGRMPGSWELVRRSPDGQTEVLAKHALAFDVAADGSILYSDGVAITHLGPGGKSEQLLKAEWIEQVLAL